MQPLNVGIIGCGVVAPTHAESFSACENVRLTWACDLIDQRAAQLARRFAIPRTTPEASDVLSDPNIDIVSICTDHASHADLACRALSAGKHVLVEKALAPSRSHLSAMLAEGDRRPKLCFGGIFQHRFNPVYAILRRRIEAGDLGEMLTAGIRVHCHRSLQYYRADTWRGTWAGEGGSVLINQAIHTIDIVAWMLGGVGQVCAQYANRTHADVMETEDTAVGVVRFASGTLGTIKATCSSHLRWKPVVSLHGSEGMVEVEDGKPVTIDFADEKLAADIAEEMAAAPSPANAPAGKSYYGGFHGLQIGEFVEAVREGRPPAVTARDARHAVDVVLSMYESHQRGGWVDVPRP